MLATLARVFRKRETPQSQAPRPVEFEIQIVHDTRGFAKDFVLRKDPSSEAPPEHLRLGYGGNADGYLANGRTDAFSVDAILRANGWTFPGGRVLDFGCAAGRLTRWIQTVWPTTEAWGADIDAERIAWARLHLPEKFVMTTKIPHLPFPDGFFSLVFAFSVFTHIDDLAHAWLLELARVLRPNGAAVVTIMDEHTIHAMQTKYADHPLPQRLKQYRNYYAEPFEMFSITRDSVADVWHRSGYFASLASDAFKVHEIRPEFHGWQSGVVMTRHGHVGSVK